ncbi:MAG TPA: hypothetical protein VK533_05880 [Sphingomonas sp.]|uniref:hypothetical protein n=1 Tax=Sphingomonas sp. TaxID=28214 RepID=UPI002C70D9B2|nr:hypothetical protein [Sphingomonas sp.]HMI19055.1 hypothetical protein [Sphingomonas sp.]
MSTIPTRMDGVDPIDRQTRKLIQDAKRAVAMHSADMTEFARQVLAGRKQRDRYFDPMLFSNPAWDILLNLFVADADGRPVTVLESCLASTVPQGVALRWLGYLKQEEMVIETPDPARPRQTIIRLSDQTRMAISAYLGSLVSLGLGPESVMPDIPPAKG